MSLTINEIVEIAAADNEYTMVNSSDDVWYANQYNERLTDVIATIADAVLDKSDLVNGKVPASQLPSYVDDVLEYANFASFPAEGETGKIYIDLATNKTYRWGGVTYAEVSASLALGETASTAYRGDRGATAYSHSQNGNVHVTAAQKAAWNAKSDFSGSYEDLTNKPTIPEAYVHPTTHPASMVTGLADVATSGSYNDLSNKPTIPTVPTSLPANGGNADTVDNKHASDFATATHTHSYNDLSNKPTIPTVPASLPANGGNADTVDNKHASDFATATHAHSYNDLSDKPTIPSAYTHPATHPASMITGLAKVATSGSYNDLTNKPTIPSAYTLPAAGSNLGGVKTGGDVTISNGTINVNDNSHNHTINNVDGLQSALNNKSDNSHKHYATNISVTGEDLNNYIDAGIYTFAQAYAPSNVPAGTNGWLIVIPWQQGNATVKQIWLRHGSINVSDMETYVRTKIGTHGWSSWSRYYTTANPPTYAEVGASPAFTNSSGGVEYSYGSGSGKNVLTEISNMPQGLHTAYAIGGTTGNPRTTESFRFLIHKTSGTIGWIMAWDAQGSIFTNYQSAANTFKGWKCLYDANPNSMILWKGTSYLNSANSTPQVVTPSKKLSECRTGWMLLWSDYDPGDGANDSDFCTTFIPKFTPSGGTWGGKAFYCDIPIYVGGDATDLSTEKRCIKPIYVHDDCLKGSYQNTSGGRNDVVLRAVYEV